MDIYDEDLNLINHDQTEYAQHLERNRTRAELEIDYPTHTVEQLVTDITPTPTPRSWINEIHDWRQTMNVDVRDLMSNVVINYNPATHCFNAMLHGIHIEHMSGGSEEHDNEIRQQLTEQLIQHYMEENPMPYATGTLNASTFETANIPEPRPEAPKFVIQQNTQATELRDLRNDYPREIFEHNYQVSQLLALHNERGEVRAALRECNRMKALLYALHNTPRKYMQHTRDLISSVVNSRQLRNLEGSDGDPTALNSYRGVIEAISYYQQRRITFNNNVVRYSGQQAQYNQRAAMIRQKPSIPKVIDVQTIVETVSQWEKVWGISICTGEEGLHIRIGLCNIIMEESAVDTAYDEAKPITLAPLFFTINIKSDGSFVCRSTNNATAGLSGTGNCPGTWSYDFHPHQLSDTPCFGSFGQSFIDMAIKGETVALISGIIAFYSQYNSEDSAGVNARSYHPSLIGNIRDASEYSNHLYESLTRWNFHTVDSDKLNDAVQQYMNYHANERHENAPERLQRLICYCCENRDVSDGNDYYGISNGERVCNDCWENNYCSDCERHNEDCDCSRDEY